MAGGIRENLTRCRIPVKNTLKFYNMKTNKLIGIILQAFCMICALGVSAKSKGIADIVMKDGSTFQSVNLDLPKGWDKTVKFKDTADKEVKLESNDIDYIVFWHKDAPDHKALIRYMFTARYNPKTNEIDTVPRQKEKWWFALESSGDHLSYWVCFQEIKPSKKGISYIIRDYPHHFVKPEMPDRAFLIQINGMKPSTTRNWLKGFLADDPLLTEAITDKGYFSIKKSNRQGNFYNPFFFEQIAVDYNPQK